MADLGIGFAYQGAQFKVLKRDTLKNTMKINCKSGMFGGALAVTALALGTMQAQAQPSMAQLKTAGMQLRPVLDANLDKLFMLHAAQGNMAEVMTGQLALKKSSNAGVREVAKTIIMGHSMAQKDLAKLFQAKGMMMPKDAGPMNMAVYKVLSGLRGAAFDKAFMGGQVGAHENTIVLFEHETMAGRDAAVKMHAMNKLPDIIGHTALIYTVAKQVGAPGIDMRPAPVKQTAMQATMPMMKMKSGMMMKGKM